MSFKVAYAYIKSHPLFAGVPEQRIDEACAMARIKTSVRGEIISYGDGGYSRIFLLINGKMKITGSADGDNELIKDILTAPDVFGDLGLAGNFSKDERAETLTANTTICIFSAADFKRILHDSMAAFNYANIVNNKLKKLEGRHADLVFHDAKYRLIRFIRNWARTEGNVIGDKIVINNYLTHSDIAAVIATSRQSVNVLFNELRDAGLLFYNRQRIELHDARNWN